MDFLKRTLLSVSHQLLGVGSISVFRLTWTACLNTHGGALDMDECQLALLRGTVESTAASFFNSFPPCAQLLSNGNFRIRAPMLRKEM